MIHFKYDINNHNNTDIINTNYNSYKKALHNNKEVEFLNKMFLYLLHKNNYNLIKKLINNTINIKKNPFRYDYKNINEYNIENQKKYDLFEKNYKFIDYNKHYKDKDTNVYNNVTYNKDFLVNFDNMPVHNITFDTEHNIDEMVDRFNNVDIDLKKKYFYIKQYEEYLYNLDHVFTV
tara:strand:+ start:387 stop:917 length:531 start_codon:yes stop_codon:yes gene_type:complete